MERPAGRRRRRVARAAFVTATVSTMLSADATNNEAGASGRVESRQDAGAPPSTLRELQRISSDLQTIGEHDLWSADARDAIDSLERGERRRLAERDAGARPNLRRRGLSPKATSEERYPERRLGRGVGMRRSFQPMWHGGGKAGKTPKSNKSSKTSTSDDQQKHYVVVDWAAPPPSPPAYSPWHGGWHDGHIVERDAEDDDWYHGGWKDPYKYIEECYDVDEMGHIVWVKDSNNDWMAPAAPDDVLEEDEMDEESSEDEESKDKYDVGERNFGGRWNGDTRRDSGRQLQQYYYVTYDGSKSAKKDSKSAKTSKSWTSPSWWAPPPSWTYPGHKHSSGDSEASVDADRRDHHAVMVMHPKHYGSKSAKAKSGKTKAGKACFVMRDNIVGESYCGMDFKDASAQCTTKCASNRDCAWGEMCFAGVTDCAEADGYCGADADDASSQCANECASDGDCSRGEACFYDVTCAEPEEGYCGKDFETAASVCSPECISDADCESDETCFVGPLVDNYCDGNGDKYCYDPDRVQCGPKCDSDADCSRGTSCLGGFAAELCAQFNGRDDGETSTPTYSPTEAEAPPTKEPTKKPAPECPAGCNDCDPDSPLPCPPSNLKRTCNKYQRGGSFLECYEMCKPSFCCIHDSLSKTFAPSCAQEYANCELYYPCYVVWWKLHDTIGPATYLRVEQNESFFRGLTFDFLQQDFEEDEAFFQQLFGHHFDGDDAPNDDTFENEDNW